MQERKLDGSYGELMPFDSNDLEKALADSDVEHVEVFNATEEELKRRKDLATKKSKQLKTYNFKKQVYNRKKRKVKNKMQRRSRKNNKLS